MQKLDIIYDLVKEINKKQDSQSEILSDMRSDISRNTDDLQHHIKRTDLLEADLKEHKVQDNIRFEHLETPKKTVKNVAKFVVWAGGIATGLYAVYRILNVLHVI